MGRGEVHQSEHDYPMELLFVGVGNAGGHVIETVITIFALAFLGIALAVLCICFMVWLALNES